MEIGGRLRTVEAKLREAQWFIEYWRALFPFIDDFIGTDDDDLLQRVLDRRLGRPLRTVEEIGVDPVRLYARLTAEEYTKLSVAERNQRALDAYVARPKSDWEIGREYERYVGHLYEEAGYRVEYRGILDGFNDLGRDLIARSCTETVIIQCKCWSRHKVIHERHVNQLFGTSVHFRLCSGHDNVRAVLCTTTVLSDMAKRFAATLGIEARESLPLGDYPRIKCNISRNSGERIYHLPFDQQYDRTIVEQSRGECCVSTVREAESRGFRRAWRWHGKEA